MRKLLTLIAIITLSVGALSAQAPQEVQVRTSDMRMYDIIESSSASRLEKDITKLVSFGTRHTLSYTVSQTRGIGAARWWI